MKAYTSLVGIIWSILDCDIDSEEFQICLLALNASYGD